MRELKRVAVVASSAILTVIGTLNGQVVVSDVSDNEVVDILLDSLPKHGISAFRTRLSESVDSLSAGSAVIREDESAQRALAPYEAQREIAQIDGYRVGVYFNNSAQARSGAIEVVRRCDSLLRDIPSTMSYDNPYFKVSLGYCTSEEEAVILLHRVQRYFPKAYLMRERISAEDIVLSRERELSCQETL